MKKELWFWMMSFFNYIIPKNKNLIVVYGRKMLNDNSEAFLDYLLNNRYDKKYRIVLLINKNVQHQYQEDVNFKIVNSTLITIWYILRAKYIFHSQGMSLCQVIPSHSQIVFNLWHGSPLKKVGNMAGFHVRGYTDTYMLCASPFFVELIKKCFAITDEQVFVGSNPRNDVLFHKVDIRSIMKWTNYSKIVVMMPTFRNSAGLGRIDAEKDFPIINSFNISDLNHFLSKLDILLVIKPHPYQNEISFLNHQYSHIKVVTNSVIHNQGLKLYELLGNSDALITDFSSVYFDYLLLNKPIGFAVDDIDSYRENRGYTIDNPLELMPGMKLKTIDDLKTFVKAVDDENDFYEDERKKVNELCNVFTTDDASLRILNHVGITLY